MSSILSLRVKPRTASKRSEKHQLRAEGRIPGVVYGAALKAPVSIDLTRRDFVTAYKQAGESTLVELQWEEGTEKPLHVLIQDYQIDPLRDEVIHADFRAVDMNKKVDAKVKLRFSGESAAVKSLGGVFVHPMDEVVIRALPKDLMHFIEVDISPLNTYEDAILLKDIKLADGVEIVGDLNRTIAVVVPPRSEEELAKLNEAVEMDVTKIEKVETKKKDEDAEEADGADATKKPAAEKKADKK